MSVLTSTRPLASAASLAILSLVSAFNPATGAEVFAVADTWIDGAAGSRDTNNGASNTLRLRNSGTRISLIRFAAPLPDPAGKPVTLNLVVNRVNRAGQVEVRRVQGAWTERTVTFNTRPAIAASALSSRAIGEPHLRQVVRFDVTSAVMAWRANPSSNFGLAVMASPGSLAEIYFDSREGGTAPSLRVSEANQVTVGKAGGDYSDIASAIANAFAGDRWCAANPPQFRCTVNVDAGVFVVPRPVSMPAGIDLAGREKGQTFVIGAPGSPVLFEMIDSSVRDLTLINIQPDGTGSLLEATLSYRPFGATIANPIRIERVAARAEGTEFVSGIGFDNLGVAEVHVTDSEIVAIGGNFAGALSVVGIRGPIEVARSTLFATASNGTGLQVTPDADDAVVHVEGSVIYGTQTGVSMLSGRAEALEIVRTHVTGAEGTGIRVRFGATNLVVLDSHVGGTSGVAWEDAVGSLTIDGTTIDASNDALTAGGITTTSPLDVAIVRSQLIAGQRAVVTNGGSAPVRVDAGEAHIRGVFGALTTFGAGTFTISSSVFEGPFELSAGFALACGSEVYDGELRLLDTNCMPR